MTEQLLQRLKQLKGSLLIKANGSVCIRVNEEEAYLEQLENESEAVIFAQGIQLALRYFIGYAPEIIKQK